MNDGAILNFWRAYLIRAIKDLDEWPYQHIAEAFIMDDDQRELGFRWVCEVLGMDADTMRKKIMNPALRRRITHGNRSFRRAA